MAHGEVFHEEIRGVDCHAHVFTRTLPFASDRHYTPKYDATIEDYLGMLESNGISHGVLVQPSFLGTDNGYLLEALRREPRRLRGIVVLSPHISRDDLRELGRTGVVGLRLNVFNKSIPPLWEPVWKRHLAHVAELEWQVEVHAQASRLPEIVPPLLQTGVRVVVDHFGRIDEGGIDSPGFRYLLELGATRRVWVKLSAAYRLPDENRSALAAIPLLRESFGVSHLLWGSDWPHTQFEKVINPAGTKRCLEMWFPDPTDRNMVLVGTPTRLFKFEEK